MTNTKIEFAMCFSKNKVLLFHTFLSTWLRQWFNNELFFRCQIANVINNHKTFQIDFS
jgi:hypothetical protein